MESPEFIKCEPEWYPSTEESSESVPSFDISPDNLVEVKIESGVSSNEQLEDEGCSEEAFKEECEEGAPNEGHGIHESTSDEMQTTVSPEMAEKQTSSCNQNNERQHSNKVLMWSSFISKVDNKDPTNGKDSKAYCCNECGKIFLRRAVIMRHVRAHSNYRPFSCSQCDKTFTRPDNLRKHLLVHRDRSTVSCNSCNKKFPSSRALEDHIVHNCVREQHICPTCGDSFALAKMLERHMNEHSKERRCICSTCGKRFVNKRHLRSHIVTHSSDKRYSCNMCDMKFKRRGHLRRHSTIHSERTSYPCSACGRTFTRKENLQRHLLSYSGIALHAPAT